MGECHPLLWLRGGAAQVAASLASSALAGINERRSLALALCTTCLSLQCQLGGSARALPQLTRLELCDPIKSAVPWQQLAALRELVVRGEHEAGLLEGAAGGRHPSHIAAQPAHSVWQRICDATWRLAGRPHPPGAGGVQSRGGEWLGADCWAAAAVAIMLPKALNASPQAHTRCQRVGCCIWGN